MFTLISSQFSVLSSSYNIPVNNIREILSPCLILLLTCSFLFSLNIFNAYLVYSYACFKILAYGIANTVTIQDSYNGVSSHRVK